MENEIVNRLIGFAKIENEIYGLIPTCYLEIDDKQYGEDSDYLYTKYRVTHFVKKENQLVFFEANTFGCFDKVIRSNVIAFNI